MRAIIMAGGEGTRLRPLTCDIPKPMTRLCGRPVLEYILDLLDGHGIRQATVTMQYLPAVITSHFGESYKGLRLRFLEEDKPLGTAGCVRYAASTEENPEEEELLVISGDALTSVDLTAALAFHRHSGAAVTLVVTRVEDPREYGLVETTDTGRVTGFLEKPGWAQVRTDAANTGIYILSPEVLTYVPKDTPFDFAKDLFPILLREGLPLYAYETRDYWCDIGDLHTYVSCQRDILEGNVGAVTGEIVLAGKRPEGQYTLIPPVYIGRDVHIGTAAQIGPFAVLDDNCHVGNSAKVRGSVLLESAYVGDRASLTGALVCHGGSVRKGASLYEGAVIGEGAVVGEYASVNPDVRIWPGKTVESASSLRENLSLGNQQPGLFDDDGITGETGVEMTPESCARLGAAVGSLSQGEKIAVGCGHDSAASVLKMALISGILSAGGQVWDFSACIEPQFDYFVNFTRMRLGVYVTGGSRSRIHLLTRGGLPATRSMERSVETRLATGNFNRIGWEDIQEPTDMSGMRQLYRQELIDMAPEGLSGVPAEVRGADYEPVRLLRSVLSILGCEEQPGCPRFHLGCGGRRLSIYDEKAGYVWPEKVLALCCYMDLRDGKDLALPYDAPLTVEEMARKMGRSVLRYLNCPADSSDEEARKAAAAQPWVRDGLMMAVHILNWLKHNNMTLSEILGQLPSFAVASRTVACRDNPGRMLRSLGPREDEEKGEGARIRMGRGYVTVRPTKRGKSLVLTAEAPDMESAEDICGELVRRLDTVSLDIGGENR